MDGGLLVATEDGELRVVEVEPLYFRQVDGPFNILFREDDQGRITRMYINFINFTAFDKLDWYETFSFNIALLLGCVLIFLSLIPVAAIRAIRNSRLSGERNPLPRGACMAQWFILGICALNLLVVVGTAWGAMGGVSNELLDPPPIIKIMMGLGVLSATMTVGALVYTALAWKNSYWGIAARAYYTLVAIAAVAFV